MSTTVCIIAEDAGTLSINKILLPLGHKAILTHLIESFPADSRFVVVVGREQEQVCNYLALAHPGREFNFVAGAGTNSMLALAEHLTGSFYLATGDVLCRSRLPLEQGEDWLATPGGLAYVHDRDGFFARCRQGASLGEALKGKPLALDWIELGSYEAYQSAVRGSNEYDFSKKDEYLYIAGGRVIKYFADERVADLRVKRAKQLAAVVPEIEGHLGRYYAYRFQPGDTFYESITPELFDKLLNWLQTALWRPVARKGSAWHDAARAFYFDKTLERLNQYQQKNQVADAESRINGQRVPPTSALLERVAWDELYDARPVVMHGDLQFDNVIYDRQRDKFILLDWRHEFGGLADVGDLYYDFAKMLAGIWLPYERIRKGKFEYSEQGGEIRYDYEHLIDSVRYEDRLGRYVAEMGEDYRRVRVLASLIYVNMAPLHRPPFDKMLYSMGRLLLARELGVSK